MQYNSGDLAGKSLRSEWYRTPISKHAHFDTRTTFFPSHSNICVKSVFPFTVAHPLDILAAEKQFIVRAYTPQRSPRTLYPVAHSFGFGCVDVSTPSTLQILPSPPSLAWNIARSLAASFWLAFRRIPSESNVADWVSRLWDPLPLPWLLLPRWAASLQIRWSLRTVPASSQRRAAKRKILARSFGPAWRRPPSWSSWRSANPRG